MFRAAAAVAPVAMLVADPQGRLLAANQRWIDFAGPADVVFRPETWTGIFEPDSRLRIEQHMRDVAAGVPAPENIDAEMMTRAGRRWTRWWVRREQMDDWTVLTLVVIDIHDDLAQKQDLRELATHDHLTGLLNRRFFLETVGQALRRAERTQESVALLYIDLDGFKAVNDQAGHAIGDRVLAAVGARLRQAVRSADVAARLGGDEFAVLIERVSAPDQVLMVETRVMEALNGTVDVGGRAWPISASIGRAMADDFDETAESLISRADAAMYDAKRRRRDSPLAEAQSAVHSFPAVTAPESPAPAGAATQAPAPPGRPGLSKRALDDLDSLRGEIANVRRSLQQLAGVLRLDYD